MLHGWFSQLNPAFAAEETEQRWDALVQASFAAVAESEGAVIGVAGLGGLWLDEELTAGLARPAEVFSVYVDHGWLGRGVGRAMMDLVEGTARAKGFTDVIAVSGIRHKEIGYPFWNRRYGPAVRIDPDYWAEGAERIVWRMSLD